MSEQEEVLLSVRKEEDVSPECLAWADSCINSYPDDSDNNDWGNFRDALTEIIDIHPEMFVPSSSPDEEMTETDIQTFVTEGDNSVNEEASEIVSLLMFESDPSNNSLEDGYSMTKKGRIRKAVESCASTEDVERIKEDGEAEEMLESLLAYAVKDDYMSTYVQDNVDDCNVFDGLVKETPLEIFKVWELEVAGGDDEEDGIVLQLKNALDVSSTVNGEQVDAEKSSVDDLIAGISDLSLVETFK